MKDVLIAFIVLVGEILELLIENLEVSIFLIISVSAFVWKIQKEKHKKIVFNEYDDYKKIQQHQLENNQLENELQKTQKRKIIRDTKKEILDGVQISSIKKDDNAFDADLFKKWSRNIFTYLQIGNEEELKQIKSSISENFYDRRMQVLKELKRDNLELRRDDLLIEELKIFDYSKWMDKAEIKVYIKARLREYIINTTTQEIIRGDDRKLTERGFILTFRKKDLEQQVGFITNCPSCGASISDTEFGTCQYCNSLVNPIRYNWVLIKYEVL